MTKFVAPSLEESAYTCPHCGAFAQQSQFGLQLVDRDEHILLRGAEGALWIECAACKNPSIWLRERLVYPVNSFAPLPNPDLPEELVPLYQEASDIVGRSASGAAALLRLLIEKLCRTLTGEDKKTLDDNIHLLVEQRRLPTQVEQALHSIRVIGNNAVHPGEINLGDDPELAASLFMLINVIVAETISRPNQIAEIFDRLPERARKGIEEKKQRRSSQTSSDG